MPVFVERIFYPCEDIICKFDRLSYPCSIRTFDYGIVLFPEMVVRVYDPIGVRRFKSLYLRDSFTSPDAIPFGNCLLTLSAYHLLNLFEMNFFAACVTLISYLLIKLCGTMANSQFFFVVSRFIPYLSWSLNASMIIRERCSSR